MNTDSTRPDPDVLLQRMKKEDERARRAKLKIFFGFAPGVGKTYAMLESAHRLKAQGIDVVVGCIEAHGREETQALADGLEAIPKAVVEYRGTKLEELDLAAALGRRPTVILIDELAHTNAPGVRHEKRYRDVLDLLDAGIEVHTTLNVQHVESLNDVIAQITSTRVRETVPDSILDRADEIELIDIPPDDLLQRLREGKVYMPEQASRAIEHFFRRGNLLALRELALRRTADRVDADVQAYREENAVTATWAAAEKILVCVSPSPASAALVRAARRMAAGLRARWVAVYVAPDITDPFSAVDRDRLESHLRLAESLGAEVTRLEGNDTAAAILDHAHRKNVTRIIIGKPTHWRLWNLLRGSVLEDVVRGSGTIDVHVISGDRGGESTPVAEKKVRQIEVRGLGWAVAAIAAATGLAWVGRRFFGIADFAMIYLLVIMVVAARFGRLASVLAATLSVAAFDFFFVEPIFTFRVSDVRHALTFGTMFVVGLLIGGLTHRIRRDERNAKERELRTAALYSLSRELAAAETEAEACGVLVRQVRETFELEGAVLTDRRRIEVVASSGGLSMGAQELAVARWVFDHAQSAGLHTETLPGSRVTCLPVRSGPHVVAVLALGSPSLQSMTLGERDLLDNFLRQAALGIERPRLAEEARTATIQARTEEMRSTLLSSVSHDLRTPLAAITGAATTLRDAGTPLTTEQNGELLQAIVEDAERLERLVSNLLDMTRLEGGGVQLKKDLVPIEEPVGSALSRLEKRLESREVVVDVPADLPMVEIDPVLIEQVLVNLVENAIKYTPEKTLIEISARVEGPSLVVRVSDSGPGMPSGWEERIFERFQRGQHTGISGVGLGLAICRGIMTAHQGSIRAENRAKGGATFVVEIPLKQEEHPS